MASQKRFGIVYKNGVDDVTTVYVATDHVPYEIGTCRYEWDDTLELQKLLFIEQKGGASVAANIAIANAANTPYVVKTSTTSDDILIKGAYVSVIAQDGFGWIVCGGRTVVKNSSGAGMSALDEFASDNLGGIKVAATAGLLGPNRGYLEADIADGATGVVCWYYY